MPNDIFQADHFNEGGSVIGVVETHGRKETEALVEGLEVIPRRRMEYKGQWLEEMDIDVIARTLALSRPAVEVRLHRARELLRESLADVWKD